MNKRKLWTGICLGIFLAVGLCGCESKTALTETAQEVSESQPNDQDKTEPDSVQVEEDAVVLLQEDFDSYEDVELKAKKNKDQGLYFQQNSDLASAKIREGRLYLMGDSFDNVYFRDTESWTNYTVEADVCLTNANGWGGILYRMNGENSGQLALFSPGKIALKGFLEPGLWYELGATEENRDTGIGVGKENGTVFRVRIRIHENSAEVSYALYDAEGNLSEYAQPVCVKNTFPHVHMTGGVGVAAAEGCELWIDNVLVTEGEPREERPAVADIFVPESGIVNPPVVAQILAADTDLTDLGERTPAVALMEIDKDLKLVNQEAGCEDVTAFLETYGSKVIPAFFVDSREEVEALISYLRTNDVIDVYAAADSENWELVRYFREHFGEGRGMLLFPGFSAGKDARKEAVVLTNKALASVVLSKEPLTETDASYFYSRMLNPWFCVQDAKDVYKGISVGAAGLVAADTTTAATVYDIYESITETTVSGRPIISAHRGHSSYPNNTVLALRKAMEEANALAAEIDLQTTKDGEIILMHDDTINKTTTGTGKVKDLTVADLKQFRAIRLGCEETDEIPTLEEVFQAFAEDDLFFVCEMKGMNARLIERFNELVEQYNYQDRVAVFMGPGGIDRYNYKKYTDGVGYISSHCNEVLNTEDDLEAIEKFLTYMSVYSNQLYFSGYDTNAGTTYRHTHEKMHYLLSARGFVNGRTITNGQALLDSVLLTELGAATVLTDDVKLTYDYAYYIEAKDAEVKKGAAIPTEQTLHRLTYTEPVACEMIELETTEDSKTVVYYADVTTAASAYRVYSEPVTVTFQE